MDAALLCCWQEERDQTSRALICQLEADLAAASSAASTQVQIQGHENQPSSQASAPILRAIMPPDKTADSSRSMAELPVRQLDGHAGASLLSVVTAQRDRLKRQVLVLEDKLHSAQQDVARGQSKLEAMSQELASKHRFDHPIFMLR